ncbi:Peroxide stress-activated histidine kinase mak2 [Cytospora mali]|uniref:histidine kinase n=1 Tax=Cytospora mali TaxID=578113 RepID=A0A194W4P7_CYTMA|nr:Peroxide stress-activated histidine kinase mak2 [Valsa mali]
MADSQPATSEGARTRETLKHAGPLLANSHRIDPSSPVEPRDLSPCPDTSLTAFLQLGCFKLGASRAFISLFDRHNQHFIAEATQSSPLDPKQVDVRQLWLCGTSRPRKANSPDELVLSSRPFSQAESSSEKSATTLPIVIVPDLRKDGRFSGGRGKERWPDHGFYAGVPLRAKNGINIGVYSVLDESPRSDLDKDSKGFLREMARIVMHYLESRAAKDSIHRGERMIRGLGSFVEGKATLTSSTNAFENVPGQKEGSLNETQQDVLTPGNVGLQREQDAAFAKSVRSDSPHQLRSIRLPSRPVPTETKLTSSTTRTGVVSTLTTSDKQPEENKHATITASDPYHNVIKDVFSRASNIIRESIEVEGALFLDASIGSFGGLVYGHKPRDSSESGDSPPYISSNEDQPISSSPPSTEDGSQFCDILGFSTGQASSIDGATMTVEQVPERLLSILLRRYPAGKIFNFDLDGTLLSGDSDLEGSVVGSTSRHDSNAASAGRSKKRESRPYHSVERQAKAISAIFPGARSVAVVPLWDSVKDRWFSGGVLWTNSPTRIFTVEGELSYLRAFGTTLMGEVARLNAQASDKSKSDFLSSLSHELRSPLHGVIAAVDLLNDTNIDAFQGDTVHLIETSGRTLLDTLDHLLDHSKINTYITSSKLAIRRPRTSPHGAHGPRASDMGMIAQESDAQLDVLVEEVTESVFAGYNFQVMSIARVSRNNKRQIDDEAIGRLDTEAAVEAFGHDIVKSGIRSQSKREGVLVYLDIDPTVSWQFRAQPGAIRRVVMNLLGNSLKFTTKGYIWISLRQKEIPPRKGQPQTKIVLMVSDSGKGIGDEYLQNDLFSPFKQEDPLAPGTGLGLSLVRQISSTMGGSVTVTSQLGRGTTARVTLPLARPSQPLHDDGVHQDLLEQIRGLSLCLRGFTRFHERVIEETPEHPSQVSEAAVMETLCREWLGLQIIPASAVEQERPDVFLYNEAAFTDLDGRAVSERMAIPAVVICRDALTAHTYAKSAEKSWVTEFISQPVGPRRLARSLTLAILRWRQGPRASTSSDSQAATPPIPPAKTGEGEIERRLRLAGHPQEDTCKSGVPEDRKTSKPAGNIKPTEVPKPPKSSGLGPFSKLSRDTSSAEGGTKAPSVAPGQKKYLLVDDNDINLRILCSFIKKLGYEYDTAVNGLEAVQKYTNNPELYRCVLMDISMPVLDGIQATRRIREHEQANRIQPTTVIALTGLGSASIRRDATASGVNVFLTKPVKLKSLKAVLDEYISGGT